MSQGNGISPEEKEMIACARVLGLRPDRVTRVLERLPDGNGGYRCVVAVSFSVHGSLEEFVEVWGPREETSQERL